ncbi:MAG: hypothetical protein KME64_01000 [Scytonematopsis contorta HA4267-MV1]|nr:hypothetical protein [Scytonematopsis contorta HA4267-MV1]
MGVLDNVPKIPPHFLPRQNLLETLKAKVFYRTNRLVGITGESRSIGVQGMGGIGKTVLATALARDEDIRQAFVDGVFWITLGQTPQILTWQSYLAQALGDNQVLSTEIDVAKARLRQLFADKSCLLVLDDTWCLEDVTAFDVLGEKCQMLITTRDATIIKGLGGEEYLLSVLNEQQALKMLADWIRQPLEKLGVEMLNLMSQVAQECGYLPLALAMVGAIMQGKPINRWQNILKKLHDADLDKIKQKFPDYPYADLFKAIHVSVEALEDNVKQRYLDFAVFAEDTPISEVVLQTFWQPLGLDEFDIQDIADELVSKSLVSQDDKGYLTLHDLQVDYVRKSLDLLGVKSLHNQLLNAYSEKYPDGWHTLDNDGYIFQYLAYHLFQAERVAELRQLLFDFRWLKAKLKKTNFNALIADYDFLTGDNELYLVKGALVRSAHVLAKDDNQLIGQLWGRLQCVGNSDVQFLLQQTLRNQEIRLRPLSASLINCSDCLIRILEYDKYDDGYDNGWCHESYYIIAVTQDSKHVIYAPNYLYDRNNRDFSAVLEVKVCDLQSGQLLYTINNDSGGWIKGIAVTLDGKYIIINSDEIELWNLENGQLIYKISDDDFYSSEFLVTCDDKYIISYSYDYEHINIWDLNTGELIRTLDSPSGFGKVSGFSPNGKYAIFTLNDGTLKAWDWETGDVVKTLIGHGQPIDSFACTNDGKYLVTTSGETTAKVWDFEKGEIIQTLTDDYKFHVVAITHDSKFVISRNQYTEVWDLQSGKIVKIFHDNPNFITVSPNNKYIISTCEVGTLKVWDLQQTEQLNYLQDKHSYSVNAIAITPDNKYVATASSDITIKIWDLQTRQVVYTIKDDYYHGDRIDIDPGYRELVAYITIAVTPNNKYVIYCNSHDFCVWDLDIKENIFLDYIMMGYRHRQIDDINKRLQYNAVAVTADNNVIVAYNSYLVLFDLQNDRFIDFPKSHKDWIVGVTVTSDGNYVVSASWDKTLKIWELKTATELITLIGHSDEVVGVSVTPDGKYVVSASRDKTLKIWELKYEIGAITASEIGTFIGHSDTIHGVVTMPDNKHVISYSSDKIIQVWNLENRKVIAKFTADSEIFSCAVASDGMTIVAGDKSGVVHFLQLEEVMHGTDD